MSGEATGTLALVGGAEWQDGCRKFDAALLEAAGTDEVLVLPTAAAFENPRRAVETARRYFDELGANVSGLMVLGRTEAEDETNAAVVRGSRFVYIGGGSPMHLRSVLKGVLSEHLLVSSLALESTVFPNSANARSIKGLFRT